MRAVRTSLTFVLLVGAAAIASPVRASAQQAGQCCVITAVDAATGTATARETATGRVFEFRARTPAAAGGLRVGQAVQANFARNMVSVDGRTVCCTITKAPEDAASAQVAASPRAPAPANASPQLAQGVVGRLTSTIPRVSYGEPVAATERVAPSRLTAMTTRTVEANVGGRRTRTQMLHLNGRDAIRSSGLPPGARNLLEMHVRKLRLHDSQYYLVNPELAAQWAAAHPEAADIKPKDDPDDDKSECGKASWNGIVDCGNDAAQAVQDEYERARKRAQNYWDESTEKLAKAMNEAQSCFEDHTLPGGSTPVRFSISPTMTINAEQSGSKGVAKGTVSGTVTLGIPLQSDFQARMDFLYIPCLPFAFRPKSVGADGTLTLGQQLSLDVTANGSFEKTFTVPPTGGPQIPIQVIPIIIGDVPVAVLDVSVYLEGDILLKGEGKATGHLGLTHTNRTAFEFACSGAGCSGRSKGTAAPVTTNESAQIQGELSARPGIYAALQLSLDYNVLQGRAGPEPYLLGTANGCSAVAATQQSGGASASSTNSALTADVDWGIVLRAEALAGGQRLGERWEWAPKDLENRHIWFKDMAPGGSTAFQPDVTITEQAIVARPVAVRAKMPTCYPYSERVAYQVTWSGNATHAPNAACQWQPTAARCTADPSKELELGLVWQTAGPQTVSVQLLRDEHRAFQPPPAAAQRTVTVSPQ